MTKKTKTLDLTELKQAIKAIVEPYYPTHAWLTQLDYDSDVKRLTEQLAFIQDGKLSDKLLELEKDGSIPPSASLINGLVEIPWCFMQHKKLYILGVNVPLSTKENKMLWWQHVTDPSLLAVLMPLKYFLSNLHLSSYEFEFCEYKNTFSDITARLQSKTTS